MEKWFGDEGRDGESARAMAEHEINAMRFSPCDEMLRLLGIGLVQRCSRLQSVGAECLEVVHAGGVITIALRPSDGCYVVTWSRGHCVVLPTRLRETVRTVLG